MGGGIAEISSLNGEWLAPKQVGDRRLRPQSYPRTCLRMCVVRLHAYVWSMKYNQYDNRKVAAPLLNRVESLPGTIANRMSRKFVRWFYTVLIP